jgi:hypothetical protein
MKRILALLISFVLLLSFGVAPVFAADFEDGNMLLYGDFEGGYAGFGTDYSYCWTPGSSTLTSPKTYAIGQNPHNYNPGWSWFGDHTTGSGSMLIFNGSTTSPSLVWGSNVHFMSGYDLLADNGAWDAGDVLVRTVYNGFYFDIELTDQRGDPDKGWRIADMQVAVVSDPARLTGKNGNPSPGQFPMKIKFDPGVLSTGDQFYPCYWPDGVPLYFAVHVTLVHPEVLDPYQPYDSESGWGEGTEFSGKNWATYTEFTPSTQFKFSFWAANTCPGITDPNSLAHLQVSINGEVVGDTLITPAAPGDWAQFETTWNWDRTSWPYSWANIEIKDLNTAYTGNDFVIDDMFFGFK